MAFKVHITEEISPLILGALWWAYKARREGDKLVDGPDNTPPHWFHKECLRALKEGKFE